MYPLAEKKLANYCNDSLNEKKIIISSFAHVTSPELEFKNEGLGNYL